MTTQARLPAGMRNAVWPATSVALGWLARAATSVEPQSGGEGASVTEDGFLSCARKESELANLVLLI